MASPQHTIMSSLPVRMKNPMWNPQHEYYMEDCPFAEYYGMRHPGIFERHPSYPTEHTSKMLVYSKPMPQQAEYPITHHVEHFMTTNIPQRIVHPMTHHVQQHEQYHEEYPMTHHVPQRIVHPMTHHVVHPMTHHVVHPILKHSRSYPKLHSIIPDIYRSIPL
jgi:hypothetical protein